MSDAWQTTRGKGQTIAIIDTGVGRGTTVFDGVVGGDVPDAGVDPKDQLSEWIRVHRRGEATQAPNPEVTPGDVAPLPPPDSASEASSPLLPSRETLIRGTLPLIAVTVPAIMVGLGTTAVVRRVRVAREEK